MLSMSNLNAQSLLSKHHLTLKGLKDSFKTQSRSVAGNNNVIMVYLSQLKARKPSKTTWGQIKMSQKPTWRSFTYFYKYIKIHEFLMIVKNLKSLIGLLGRRSWKLVKEIIKLLIFSFLCKLYVRITNS